MMKKLTNGDYLRILESTLRVFNIDWFNIGIKPTTIRGLYKEDNRWIIKDYLGLKKNEKRTIVLTDSDDCNIEEICLKVISFVAYDDNETNQMRDRFEDLVAELKSENENTHVIPSMEREYKEKGIQIPEVYYHEWCEDLMGYMSGYHNVEEVSNLYKRITPCRCGGKAELNALAGMGEIVYTIQCQECTNSLSRGLYDTGDLNSDEDDILDALIKDWNNGIEQCEIDRMSSSELSRKRLKPDDLIWKEYYPNNMACNGVEGLYSLVFCNSGSGKLYCCKWTIEYQLEELEAMHIGAYPQIEAYNLFMERFFEIKGILHYPSPSEENSEEDDGFRYETFSGNGVNDKGDFVRSYRTLRDAQEGALGRCGWQGINRDTLIKVEQYGDITAEELEKELSGLSMD